MAVDGAAVDIAFVSGRLESMLGQNFIDHALPESTGFRMTLESLEDRDDVSGGVNIATVTFVEPGAIGVVDLQVTLLGRRGRLLIGVCSVAEGDNHALDGSKSKEEAHTRLGDTGSIGGSQVAEPGGGALGAVETKASFATAVSLDEV